MIDVIVPVFRGHHQTRCCLESVLANCDAGAIEVVVVDDATPEPALAEYLDGLSRSGAITLLRNQTNSGFVESANRGMSLHRDRDVVLLNSDTEVAEGWLDRLAACAYREPDIGTVTPFSNNATICSYPFDGCSGGVPGTLGLAGLDRLIAATNAGRYVEIPTAVGFCMFIRRVCLDAVGFFDAERFGRGYGEENDFSLRARAAGWRNVIAADVFVYHQGSVSFGTERQALQRAGMRRLLEVHPGFLDEIGDFCHRDPVAPLRRAIDDARYALGGDERHSVLREQQVLRETSDGVSGMVQLHLTHSWDGGTNRWIADFCSNDTARRNLVLRSVSNREFAAWRIELLDPGVSRIPLMHWDLERPVRATDVSNLEYRLILNQVFAAFDVRAIVVSSLVGHSLEALDTGLPTAVVFHDLYPFCPAMFATFGQPCTACDAAALDRCLEGNPHQAFWHNTDSAFWLGFRASFARCVEQPWIQLAAPSASAWGRWAQLFPEIAVKGCMTIAHGLGSPFGGPAGATIEEPVARRKLRLVVPGRLLPHKGLALFAEAVPRLTMHADMLLLGCGRFGEPFRDIDGIKVIPHYAREDLAQHIGEFMPDAALLLSVVPESFSYTLSEMLALGLPVVATRIGAFGERIHDGQDGLLVAPDPDAVVAAVERLASDGDLLPALRRGVQARPARTAVQMVADYHALLAPADGNAAVRTDRASQTTGALRMALQAAQDRTRMEARCRGLQTSLQVAQESGRETEVQLLALQRRCFEAEARADKRAADCDAMRRSRSWQITAPLRLVTSALRRLLGSATPVVDDRPRRDESADLMQPSDHKVGVRSGDADARAVACRELRERLAVPGRSRIVLGSSPDTDGAFASRFLDLAADFGTQRNGIFFVLRGVTEGNPRMRDRRIALLIATRRLFVEPFGGSVADILPGADVVVLDASDPLRSILTAESSRGAPSALILAPKGVDVTVEGNAMSNNCHLVSPDDAVCLLGRLLDQRGLGVT